MTDRLYIIGNGFDMHHYLKTSYYDFAKFIKENDKDLYDILESYISYPNSDKDLWARFEENLANLDAEEILSEHIDALPNYASDDFRDRDRHVFPDVMREQYENLTHGLFKAFRDFIKCVTFNDSAYSYKVEVDISSLFLTFNYTNTLEKLYNVDPKNIIYIHNSVYGNDDIILGHGIDPSNFEEKKLLPPDDLNDDELARWNDEHDDYDYSYDEGKKTLMQYFKDTYKPTKDIIERHHYFFKSISDIREVFVLGHSISKVDLPYFIEVIKSLKQDCKWFVSYYSASERDKHLNTLKSLGIQESNITLFELIDIQEKNKQLKIDFTTPI